MGVLGVLVVARLVGVILSRLLSTSADGAGKDAIFADVGVLKGRRLRGGSLMGCKDFLFTADGGASFSGTLPVVTVRPLLCRCWSRESLAADIWPLGDAVGKAVAALPPMLSAGVARVSDVGV